MVRSVLVSTVRRLVRRCWWLLCSRFLFLVGFRIGPTFAVMLSLFAAVCSVSFVLAQFGRTHVWTGQGHIFATLQYKRRAPSWIKLKPEDLKEQIGKLAEKYDALVVVTLRDGFGVPQVKLITGIKILRIIKKEDFAPSIPEVLYFLVKKAKSMRKHLDKNRKDKIRSSVSSSLRAAFTALRGTTDASSSCLPTGSTSLLRPRLELVTPFSMMYVSISLGDPDKECDPNVSVRRIETSFRKGRGSPLSGIPSLWNPILLRMRRYFASVSCTSTLVENFEHSLSGMKGNSLS